MEQLPAATVAYNLDILPDAAKKRFASEVLSATAPGSALPKGVVGGPARFPTKQECRDFINKTARESAFGFPMAPGVGSGAPYPTYTKAHGKVNLKQWRDIASQTSPHIHESPEQIDLGRYCSDNLPSWITTDDLRELSKLYARRFAVHNATSFLVGLKEIGYFFSLGPVPDPLILLSWSAVSAFVAHGINALKVAAIAGLWVFGSSLRDPNFYYDLKMGVATALTDWMASVPTRDKFVRAASSVLVPSFFRMGFSQNPEDTVVDGFFFENKEVCPLFSNYGHPKLLSHGSYGVVFRYTINRDASFYERNARSKALVGLPDHVAIKLQTISDGETHAVDSSANRELRILHAIQRMADHWPKERFAFPYNHLRLYDYARCEFDPRQAIGPLLAGSGAEVLTEGNSVNQIIVEEYAVGGSLSTVMYRSDAGLRRVCSFAGFTGICAQVLAHVQALGAVAHFTHRDLKPANIFLQTVPLGTQIQYLYYHSVLPTGQHPHLYVPLWGTGSGLDGYVAKLGDFGMSRILVQQKIGDTETRVSIPADEEDDEPYNPGFDAERFGMTFMGSILEAAQRNPDNQKTISRQYLLDVLAPIGWRFLGSCMHRWQDDKRLSAEALAAYRAVAQFVEKLTVIDPPEQLYLTADIERVSSICFAIYVRYSSEWEDDVEPDDLAKITTLLGHEIFNHLRAPPSDAVPNVNVLYMNHYNIATFKPYTPPQAAAV
jgi:hypothetical protein